MEVTYQVDDQRAQNMASLHTEKFTRKVIRPPRLQRGLVVQPAETWLVDAQVCVACKGSHAADIVSVPAQISVKTKRNPFISFDGNIDA